MSEISDDTKIKSLWAKFIYGKDGILWLPLYQHLDDASEIAARLYDYWLSPNAKRTIESSFADKSQARSLVVFLGGVHDIGKATPAFSIKNSILCLKAENAGLFFSKTKSWSGGLLHHSTAGQLILERHLATKGCSKKKARCIASIVGAHHGVALSNSDLADLEMAKENTVISLGNKDWETVQDGLIDWMLSKANFKLESIEHSTLSQPALVLIEGIIVLADWIASNMSLFRLFPENQNISYEKNRAEKAWQKLDLPFYDACFPQQTNSDELFQTRFDLGKNTKMRPVQKEALRAAYDCDLDSLLFIEAPPGEGKTEAALLAAEIIVSRSGANGIHIALPTQATTNAMFERTIDWLKRIPGKEKSVALLHGNASMNDLYEKILIGSGIEPSTEKISAEELEDTVYAHRWLMEKRKSPLSEYIVGTIDQLLFMALQARHLSLRHLGLANKVVIIDECHAYDTYMNVYLEMALEWLGAYGVPVILLSATLPEKTKKNLSTAYQKGHLAPTDTARKRNRGTAAKFLAQNPEMAKKTDRLMTPENSKSAVLDKAYPLITTSMQGSPTEIKTQPSARKLSVNIHLLDEDIDQLATILTEKLKDGGCALVIRNTVNRAQLTFDYLASIFDTDSVSLMHSRFLVHDRIKNDSWLVRKFGKANAQDSRPKKHIVVSTQVVEQSLDVDFDILITDIAPMDLLLQRMGRLHRHDRKRPNLVNTPNAYITAVKDWNHAPIEIDKGCSCIYGNQALFRSGCMLKDIVSNGKKIAFPEEIPVLVEKAYCEDFPAPAAWKKVMEEADKEEHEKRLRKKSQAQTFCLNSPKKNEGLNSWVNSSVGNADEEHEGRAQVRDISDDSVEVLALCKTNAGWALPPWIDPEGEWEGTIFETENLDKALSKTIRSCMVRLPAFLPDNTPVETLISALEERYYIKEWQRIPLLRGQLILPFEITVKDTTEKYCNDNYEMQSRIIGLTFTYSRKYGLVIEGEQAKQNNQI